MTFTAFQPNFAQPNAFQIGPLQLGGASPGAGGFPPGAVAAHHTVQGSAHQFSPAGSATSASPRGSADHDTPEH
jgi:hypothetical protein